ncbi:MAG TPA: carboxypeptidase regulatory-like domain-containing protein [Vicinamibacterales bacterium]|jgi:plastocyanin|nr:carboxypeptidase regulatory-like domain-containing protein [Vicinamibacterales bacterium]
MFPVSKTIAAALAVGLLAACGSGPNESAKPSSPAAATGGQKVDQATAGTISGTISFAGEAPRLPAIQMASDPTCASAHKDPVQPQTYVVKDGGLDNVFVYIKDGLDKKYVFTTPTEPVTLDQKGCEYIPHVLGIRVGQPLQIANDDNTMHNVHGMPETNQEFNIGQPLAGMKSTVTFTAPEVLVPFKCDVHSWMNAYIGVVNHPYFAVSADGGKFELRDVPPGTYTIEAVHEKLGRQTQTVTLGPKDSKQVSLTFKAGA